MNDLSPNDLSPVIAADKAHVWHHLSQHKPYETADPRVFVEGRGMRLWDAKGTEYLDAVSGGVWTVNVGYGRESIANAVREGRAVYDNLKKFILFMLPTNGGEALIVIAAAIAAVAGSITPEHREQARRALAEL